MTPAAPSSPEQVLRTYLGAIYSHDYETAYRQVSPSDRALQSREAYVRAHGPFSGAALELARALADEIRYEGVRTSIAGNRAVVTFRAILPDANDAALQELVMGFDEQRLAARSPGERGIAIEKVKTLARTGRMPVVTGDDERWELSEQDGRWWIVLNWDQAVVVRFTGGVKGGLPWRFGPVDTTVRAMPGEPLRVMYRASNLSPAPTTGKARHRMRPPEKRGYLRIIQCFCLIEQTLGPRETREMPVFFVVNPGSSAPIREVTVDYQFYPAGRRAADGH